MRGVRFFNSSNEFSRVEEDVDYVPQKVWLTYWSGRAGMV
jgi:hypothetical protein